MKAALNLLVLFQVLSVTGFAQRVEKEFTGYPTSQLQFSTYYLALPQVKYENQFRELGSSPAFGFQMGIGYYQALKNGFGFSFQAQARIQNSRIDVITREYNSFSNDSSDYTWKSRIVMPIVATPIFIEKHFILGQRHWLNAAVGIGFTYFPYESRITEISYERYLTDSTNGLGIGYSYDQPTQRLAIDYRLKLGYKFMFKSQNTISVNLNYTYAPFKFVDAITTRSYNGAILGSGSATQSLSYFGVELAYAYSFRKQNLEGKYLGESKSEEEKPIRPNKLWVETSFSAVHIRQTINKPNSLFETVFYPQAKYNVGVEFEKKWNQRYAFSYLRYWEVGPSITLSPFGGASSSGVDPTFFLSASFGKDLVKTKREGFKIKPWIGGAVSLFPYAFTDKNYPGSGGNGSTSFDGDTISFTHTDRYPNPFNFYASAALEFEIRVFRAMRFSITPSYTQGILKNSIASYSYNFNNIETGNFDLISRLSHTELRFALKIPIHYGKQVN
jgi:hypothetical protein